MTTDGPPRRNPFLHGPRAKDDARTDGVSLEGLFQRPHGPPPPRAEPVAARARQELVDRLEAAGLDCAEELRAHITEGRDVQASATALDALALGASRLGGMPDVPADFVWPASAARPLHFLAQIDLRDVADASEALPSSGWLLFFYDARDMPWGTAPSDGDGWAVRYVDAAASLERRGRPKGDAATFSAASLRFAPRFDLPGIDDPLVQPALRKRWAHDNRRYGALVAAIQGPGPLHRWLGHPAAIQGGLRETCQLAANGLAFGIANAQSEAGRALLARDEGWSQLLQLDSDPETIGFEWHDAGRLHFMIREEDRAAHRFDRVWLILGCG